MSTKLQITITGKEKQLLADRAATLGYNVTKFAKFLLSNVAYEQLQENIRLEKLMKKSLAEYKAGKTMELKSIDDIDNI